MGARQKLNANYLLGSLALGGIVGLVTQSWTVFIATSIVLIGSSIYLGEIRL
jgi:hypothetical protein